MFNLVDITSTTVSLETFTLNSNVTGRGSGMRVFKPVTEYFKSKNKAISSENPSHFEYCSARVLPWLSGR